MADCFQVSERKEDQITEKKAEKKEAVTATNNGVDNKGFDAEKGEAGAVTKEKQLCLLNGF